MCCKFEISTLWPFSCARVHIPLTAIRESTAERERMSVSSAVQEDAAAS